MKTGILPDRDNPSVGYDHEIKMVTIDIGEERYEFSTIDAVAIASNILSMVEVVLRNE